MNDAPQDRALPRRLAVLALLLLPLVWLWPHVFGERRFVPYDVDAFPPASSVIDADELAAARAGANLDVTEVPIWFLPELRLAHDELAAGRLPTWNPNARHGATLHAHGLIGLCYPPNWPALVAADPATRLGLVAWCNLALGGLLLFGLFRSLGHSLLPAWAGAALFELSLPMAANAFFWMRLGSFVWLPGILWAMHAVARRDGFARCLSMAATATCFAMTWLAGFPPFAASATFFAGLWFVWLCLARHREQGLTAARELAIALTIALLLGACWTLPQVLPSLAFFPESARPLTPAMRDIEASAFAPAGLIGWLLPDAFGFANHHGQPPSNTNTLQLLWATRVDGDGKTALPNYNFTEYAVFASSFALLMALLGAFAGRGRHAGFARVAMLIGLGLAMFWPGISLLFHLPVVQNVWPMRWLPASTPFVLWLAVLGIERLLAADRRRPIVAAAATAGALAVLLLACRHYADTHAADVDGTIATIANSYQCSEEAVYNHICGEPPAQQLDRIHAPLTAFSERALPASLWLFGSAALLLLLLLPAARRPRVTAALLLLLTGSGLWQLTLAGRAITRGTDAQVHDDTAVHAFLRERAAALHETTGGFTIVRAKPLEGLPAALPPGQVMAPGLRDLNFYSHADRRTLQPIRRLLERFADQLPPDAAVRITGKGFLTSALPARLLQFPLFDLLNVRYALATEDLSSHGLTHRVGPELEGRGAFFVYERPTALPRVYVVPRVVVLDDDDAVLDALTARDLVPRHQAFTVAADATAAMRAPTAADDADAAAPRRVRVTDEVPDRIELAVDAGDARFLVLADTFLPGWTATVDDRPAPIVRCNHSQRLVTLPRQACRVQLRYHAPGLAAGCALSGIATLLAIATVALWWRRRRRT